MATITGLTAARMQEIEAASVVDGDVVGNDLILTTKGGSQINAGNVRGPQGVQGPIGSDLSVITAKQILDVGLSGQIRAGRQLTATDFTNMGLAAPLGLWNLSNLNDSSGNGRNLSNKGAVPFGVGIEGVAASAAQFVGSTGQALYISDTGAADPFRIRTGSVGCWFKTPRRAAGQGLVSKYGTDGQLCYWLYIGGNNFLTFNATPSGLASAQVNAQSKSDVCDDRWHFGVGVYDGSSMCIYVDGILEGTALLPVSGAGGIIFPGNSPLNIGNLSADASTVGTASHFGRIDEAFITSEVLSEDQICNLYCAKIPHTLGTTPLRVTLNVRRQRRGGALAVSSFPSQPLRLYNFSAGSLGDEGSNGVSLTNTGNAVSIAGPDGSRGNAFNFNGSQRLFGTDAGLPSGLSTKSWGCWFKTDTMAAVSAFLGWGSYPSARNLMYAAAGKLVNVSAGDSISTGIVVADGKWHFAVCVEDNAAPDGLKRKVYLDGRLIGASGTLGTITLAGATAFSIGADTDSSGPFYGQVDGVFVCNYTMTFEQIASLYAKGFQTLTRSPKNVGDHVEAMDNNNIFAAFDTLDVQHQIDLAVA
jgi:hypothetical protein